MSAHFTRAGIMFQSTRPRGTRRRHDRQRAAVTVSIHASARDATGVRRVKWITRAVSIHASARDATSFRQAPACLSGVSIHASARDATAVPVLPLHRAQVSIHASARDATSLKATIEEERKFQSTRPRGTRRQGKRSARRRRRSFNPRVRAGRDQVAEMQ